MSKHPGSGDRPAGSAFLWKTAGSGIAVVVIVAVAVVLATRSPATSGKPDGAPAAAKPAQPVSTIQPVGPDSAAVMAMLAGVTNATCPMRGVASGGQVDEATVQRLAKSGFRTVLDLRAPDEPRGYDESGAVKKAGLDYVILPVTGATLNDALFDRVRGFMQDADHHPVMVHCGSGNRVGVVLMPWLVLDRGWSLDRAIEMARLGGMRDSPMQDLALAYIAERQSKR